MPKSPDMRSIDAAEYAGGGFRDTDKNRAYMNQQVQSGGKSGYGLGFGSRQRELEEWAIPQRKTATRGDVKNRIAQNEMELRYGNYPPDIQRAVKTGQARMKYLLPSLGVKGDMRDPWQRAIEGEAFDRTLRRPNRKSAPKGRSTKKRSSSRR